jgi:hypothetical protein
MYSLPVVVTPGLLLAAPVVAPESMQPDPMARLDFMIGRWESIPAGFRARETYLVQGSDAFEEVFEIAEPGKPFDVYSRTRFTRAK